MNPLSEDTHLQLCLDFANTAEWHASQHPVESLHNYDDLLDWALGKGLLDEAAAAGLQDAASRQPEQATGALARAIDLREALYRIFSAQAHAISPAAEDVDLLNQELSTAMGQVRLLAASQGFTWGWAEVQGALEAPLWPIVRSAAELLTTPAWLERVGQCADERGCGWLFLDTSKNHSRRWCDIRDCGNRAKQRRHYQRQQRAQ